MVIPYYACDAYLDAVARLEQQVTSSVEERRRLGLVKRSQRTAVEQRRFSALAGRTKVVQNKLGRVHLLRTKPWYLLQFLVSAEGCGWTTEELAMWHGSLAQNEGRGELALRLRYGLPPEPSKGACDLVQHVDGVRTLYEEVKNLQGRQANGRFCMQPIQTGTAGRAAYLEWVFARAEAGAFRKLLGDQRSALARGELPSGKLHRMLPSIVNDLTASLAPAVVLGGYDAIIGTTQDGFVRVPRADLDRAWRLHSVTKGGPRYALSTAYIMERLLATVCHVPAAAPGSCAAALRPASCVSAWAPASA